LGPIASESGSATCAADPESAVVDEGDYLNCPMTKEEYERFYDAVVSAESATVHDFDKEKFFEGCLPIEVMAHRGRDTLRFGPMKPVGLVDPRDGPHPYAAVQLRQDTLAGRPLQPRRFQTQLKWGEQARVLKLVPGLETRRVRALRHGAPQHLHQRPDRASRRRGRRSFATTCFSPDRSPGSKGMSSRPRPA
jgi:tRNA:m(5)U-54 methyltransferase